LAKGWNPDKRASVPSTLAKTQDATSRSQDKRQIPNQDRRSRIELSLIIRLGRDFLPKHRLLVLLYIFIYLLGRSVFPAAVGFYAETISNNIPSASHEAAQRPEINQDASGTNNHAGNVQFPRPKPKVALLWRAYSLWLLATLAIAFSSLGLSLVTAYLGGKVSNEIRAKLFAEILKKSMRFFQEHEAQRLTTVVNQLAVQVQGAVQDILINPVLDLIGVIILGYALFRSLAAIQATGGNQVWAFFFVIVLIALVSPWLVSRLSEKLRSSSQGVQQQNLLLASLVGGAMGAPEEIQALRAEPIFNQKFSEALAASLKGKIFQVLNVGRLNLLNRLPGDLVLASLMGLSVFIAASGMLGIDAGVVAGLMALTPAFMGSIQGFSALAINLNLAWPAIQTVGSMIYTSDQDVVEGDGEDYPIPEPTLEVRNLVFSYRARDSKKVFDDVSFSVPAGSITGLIAKAGQGKTTFFRLALRFYELSHGEILLGGIPHSRFAINSLRRHIVLMAQAPAFFHDTIRENFRIAKPAATDDELQALGETTGIWSVLVEAYGSTPLDEQFLAGGRLSGGQRKLFALTRCLLAEPSYLFLDEPTTGIDPQEKFALLQVMKQACSGRTVIVIDHDVVGWQIPFCDRFVVLDQGKITQQGTAAELLSIDGLFKDLFDRQTESAKRITEELRRAEVLAGSRPQT
jgi:ATP-binding cassette subfamily B protein